MWRFVTVALLIAGCFYSADAAPDLAGAWYPLRVGNSWVYADESRDADESYGIENPRIGRWTTTETVVASDVIPEGTRVTVRSDVTSFTTVNHWLNTPSTLTPRQREWLLRANCVYELTSADVDGTDDIWPAYDGSHHMRAAFRRALLRREVPAAYCFPMTAGGEWGRSHRSRTRTISGT